MKACPAALALAAVLAGGCKSPQHPPVSGTVESHTLDSAAVGDAFVLQVRLPPEHEPHGASACTVVYQLDDDLDYLREFEVTAGFASEHEAAGRIEPTLVVGIGHPEETGAGRGRVRDFTPPEVNGAGFGPDAGGAPEFYAFLRDELVPWVEERYPCAGEGGRALFGHSLGGLFSIYALLQHDPEAPLFHGLVAASPSIWYDGGSIYEEEARFAAEVGEAELRLFMTVGVFEGPVMTGYFDHLAPLLEGRGYGLDLDVARYLEDHVGTVSPSFEEGLEVLLADGLGGAT